MSADNSEKTSNTSGSDNNDKKDNFKNNILLNKLLQPVIPDQSWPHGDNLMYHKFESIVEDMNPQDYWDISFTDKLEDYQYKNLDMGNFKKVGTVETIKQQTKANAYGEHLIGDIKVIRKRTVTVIPSSQLLGQLTSFTKGKDNVTRFQYNTTQQKYGNKMQFNIKFDKFWSEYFPQAAGIVTVDYLDKEKHSGTKQTVELIAEINFGWNQGMFWSCLGSAANSIIATAFKNMIENQMQDMIKLVPNYIFIANQHKLP
jgi:hypothetical protein